MGFKRIIDCYQGDIDESISRQVEVVVERSSESANDKKEIITLWKKGDKFCIGYFRNGEIKDNIHGYNSKRVQANPWETYEDECKSRVCLPYPRAEEYYRKNKLLI